MDALRLLSISTTGSPFPVLIGFILIGAAGVLTIVYRRRVAAFFRSLLESSNVPGARQEVKRANPTQFLMAGIVGVIGGVVGIVAVVLRMVGG